MAHDTVRHYSQDVAFFQRFLDKAMKYTSGLFRRGDESLDEGALAMLDHLLRLGAVTERSAVLDIGCGWGSLLGHLRRVHPRQSRYTGVNPSSTQVRHIHAHVDPDARIIETTFEEAASGLPGGHDAIFMVGALCHMRDKPASLRAAASLLAPGGRLVLDDTFFISEGMYQKHKDRPETRFVQEDTFGFASITSLSAHMEILHAAGLRLVSTEDTTADYARTIELWMDRLRRLDATAFPLAEPFLRYMAVAQRGWGYTIVNHLMVLAPLPTRASPGPKGDNISVSR